MPWQSLRVTLDASRAEAFSEALMSLGAISASLEDADAGSLDETPIFGEPTEPDAGLWQHCVVSALLEAGQPPADLVAGAALAAGLAEIPAWSVETVDDQDCVRLTQSQFVPSPSQGACGSCPPGMTRPTAAHSTSGWIQGWPSAPARTPLPEPFTGLKKIEVENLMETWRDQLDRDKLSAVGQ